MVVELASFDLYTILVEWIFGGSILASGIGILLGLILIGMICRMSPLLIIMICGMFIVVFGTGYGGSLFTGLAFIFGLLYAVQGILNVINSRNYY